MRLKLRLLVLVMLTSLNSLNATPPLAVDSAKTGTPINPFIYGQFIEHLGRCIYGGIWAEMLEDRKFYYPITDRYAPYQASTGNLFPPVSASPWEIIGKPDSVTMVAKDAFVGEHSPLVRAGSGIRQHDLGVVQNQKYTGYVWVRTTQDRPAKLEVKLLCDAAAKSPGAVELTVLPGDFARHEFTFTASATTDHAQLELHATTGDVLIGTVSLMPADNVRGLRRDTLALLKQLNGTIYRWPGGNFVSGYDWRDGIGPRDRRPPRKNPSWSGIEHNDFGTDEFIAFCRELGTEPMIAANTGFGDAYSAAQWVEYCNSKSSSLAGGWRTQNGHAEPFHVKYWCVGNEMFGPWQLGFMQLSQYTIKHNLVATAMKKVDPAIVLSAVGDLDRINAENDPEQAKTGTAWSKGMLLACADHMDLMSEHFYEGRLPWNKDPRTDLLTHVAKLKNTIRHKADGHRALQASLPNLKGRVIPIAMDEWNYWHRDYVYGELGCIYDFADALGVAEGLHEYFRQSDIMQMAFYAQTVNVIGAIKTTKTSAEMETTGLVLQLYRKHFGQKPIKLAGDFGAADVAAALTADGKKLTIAIVNPTSASLEMPLNLAGLKINGQATCWQITAPDEFAHNTPGQPRKVDIASPTNLDVSKSLSAPALSIVLYQIPVER